MASAALDILRKELTEKRAQAEQVAKEAGALAQAIALLSGEGIVAGDSAPSEQDFKGLGIVDAAKRFVLEAGAPQTTRAIADALVQRGLETSSKNWLATVYSTLDNSRELTRLGSGRAGRWDRAPETDSGAK